MVIDAEVKVTCNETNNAPETVAQGQFNIDIEFKPYTASNIIDSINNMANLIWQNYYVRMPLPLHICCIRTLDIVKTKDEADGW